MAETQRNNCLEVNVDMKKEIPRRLRHCGTREDYTRTVRTMVKRFLFLFRPASYRSFVAT